jgi:drug/metabolite transporter (DMT)-like permease
MAAFEESSRRGLVLVLVSAVAFGVMPVLTKLAYREGLNLPTLLALRFGVAAVGMWLLWLYVRRRRKPFLTGFGVVLPLVALGALGYVGQSFSYFTAIQKITVSATGLLLYTYPTLVVLLAWLFFREALTPLKLAALALATLGSLMVLGVVSQALGLSSGGGLGDLNPEGVAWALSAALIYSAYIIASTRFTAGLDPVFSSAVIISSAAAVYLVGGLLAGQLSLDVTPLGLAWTVLMALVSTVLAIAAFFAGLAIVGPSRASIISTLEPTVTVALAALVLRETITTEQIFGGALILVAVASLQLRVQRPKTKVQSA